jgi:hypothetical protein
MRGLTCLVSILILIGGWLLWGPLTALLIMAVFIIIVMIISIVVTEIYHG